MPVKSVMLVNWWMQWEYEIMLKIKNLIFLVSFVFIVSCQMQPKEKTPDQPVSMAAQEKMEIKKIQEKVGGSYFLLGKYYRGKQYRKLLIEAGKILSRDEYDLKALCALGLYHMDKRQYGASRIFFEKALEKHPNEAGLYNNIGVILLKEGHLDSALLSFKKAYDIENSNLAVQANLGSIYVKHMDYVQAENLAVDAYSRKPDNAIVANNFAIILRTQGQYEEAGQIYQKILERNSRDLPANLNYAILLVEYMKKYKKGKQMVNKLEFLNPKSKYILEKIKDLQVKVEKLDDKTL